MFIGCYTDNPVGYHTVVMLLFTYFALSLQFREWLPGPGYLLAVTPINYLEGNHTSYAAVYILYCPIYTIQGLIAQSWLSIGCYTDKLPGRQPH